MKIKYLFVTALLLALTSLVIAQSTKQATGQEKKELLQLILKDKQVAEDAKDYGLTTDDLAKAMSIKMTDLNEDGQPEYIVVLEEGRLCGAHANCPDWVYRKVGGEYQLLLRTFGQELLLEKTSTNKFRDLRSEGADSAAEGSGTIYKFDGNKYQAKDCYARIYKENGKDKIVPRKCEENQ